MMCTVAAGRGSEGGICPRLGSTVQGTAFGGEFGNSASGELVFALNCRKDSVVSLARRNAANAEMRIMHFI